MSSREDMLDFGDQVLELPILAKIPEDPEIRKSIAMGEPIMVRKASSSSAKAFKTLARKLLGKRKKPTGT